MKLFLHLKKRRLRPKLQCLDNECSQLLKDGMDEIQVDWQLLTPGIHRRNAPERAIITFKKHLKAGFDTTNESLPKAIIYENPGSRGTWDLQGTKGW